MPSSLRIEMGLSPINGLPTSSEVKVFVGDEQIRFITNIQLGFDAQQFRPRIEVSLIPESVINNCTPQMRAEHRRYLALLQPFMPLYSPVAPPPRPIYPTAWERLRRNDD